MQHKESYRSTEKGNGEGKCGPFTLEACGGGTGLESQHLTRGAGTWNTRSVTAVPLALLLLLEVRV